MSHSFRLALACSLAGFPATPAAAQSFPSDDPVIRAIWAEGTDRSQLYSLAQVMMDSIGPRLTGSPTMARANDWAVAKFAEWGMSARKEQYGTWRGWDRGISHIDMLEPRVRSLEGMSLAWSAPTAGPVEAEVLILADAASPEAFQAWLPAVRGKFVLISRPETSCRPRDNWEWFARSETLERVLAERAEAIEAWEGRVANTGVGARELPQLLDAAGAAGVISSRWSEGWGVNKIFGTRAERAPVVDLSCEDYGLVYRMVQNRQGPVLRINVESRSLGEVPVYNALAEIPGTTRADEYILISAHYDSWDGSSGALDNGTGSVVLMEAMRILGRVLPRPRRTILAALWNGEEQGLNGSRAFAADHPEILANTHVVFNVDHGTGPVTNIPMQGFQAGGPHFARWLAHVPGELESLVRLKISTLPDRGGTDHAAFLCWGVPAFSFHVGDGRMEGAPSSTNRWDTRDYTWHTNRDTFDKIVFDDLRYDALVTAMLVYRASEDPERMSRAQRAMPTDLEWPPCRSPARSSSESDR